MNRPNIIFVLVDDLGWCDLQCYGSSFYETPNIDRLCREGMRFTDAYAASPVCSPTRASILSGKYPATLGLTNFISDLHPAKGKFIDAPFIDHFPAGETSLATALKEGGYRTWHVGKWHLGKRPHFPENKGFDINVGGCSWGQPKNGYFSPWGIETLADGADGDYLTDRLTDESISLIQQSGGSPFFLNLWYYTVHTPIQAKVEKVRKYTNKARQLGLDTLPTFEEGEAFPTEHLRGGKVRRRILQSDPTYAAMIESLDENIGRLLAVLEKEKLADNTLIVFTSDNGGLSSAEGSPTCNLPLSEGKGWMYEGGTREPLIVRWPKYIHPASECRVPVTSPDFYPTLLEAAGLPLRPNQHVDGVSLIPLLTQNGIIRREAIYWHYPHYGNQGGTPASSLRKGRFKLIEFFESGRRELYDLENDIGEHQDLSEVHPNLVADLAQMLLAWRNSVEALEPSLNPSWFCGEEESPVA